MNFNLGSTWIPKFLRHVCGRSETERAYRVMLFLVLWYSLLHHRLAILHSVQHTVCILNETSARHYKVMLSYRNHFGSRTVFMPALMMSFICSHKVLIRCRIVGNVLAPILHDVIKIIGPLNVWIRFCFINIVDALVFQGQAAFSKLRRNYWLNAQSKTLYSMKYCLVRRA